MSSVTAARAALAEGRMVILTDDAGRGWLSMAASAASAETMAVFIGRTTGLIAAAMEAARCDQLQLAPMVEAQADAAADHAVTVDVAEGVSTGISAGDRAVTLRALADPGCRSEDLTRPGHVLVQRTRKGGVLKRAGTAEALVDLVTLAGLQPVGALAHLVSDDKSGHAGPDELRALADDLDLVTVAVADVVAHRMRTERLVERAVETELVTAHATFVCIGWSTAHDDTRHLTLVLGDLATDDPVLVRVHSECLAGDALGSVRCACAAQLDESMRRIAAEGRGVILYLRGHEARSAELPHELAPYHLRPRHEPDDGLDVREHGIGAQILVDLGIRRLRLLTNYRGTYADLGAFGLEITERIALPPAVAPRAVARLREASTPPDGGADVSAATRRA